MALGGLITPFVWGEGGARLTPEEVARQRKVLQALAGKTDTSPVGHWTQGLARVTDAIGDVFADKRLTKADDANKADASRINKSVIDALVGPSGAAPTAGVAQELSATSPAPSVTPPVDISGDRQSFVDALLPAAIEEGKRTGVDPRIIVAQAAQETGWGKSAPGNNYFGIKSHGQDGGQNLATHEYVNGQRVGVTDSFRTFGSPAESVRGYGEFITQNPRYKPLREAQGLDAQLEALQASGYATDPNYSRSVGAIARGIQLPTEVASLDAASGVQSAPAAIESVAPQGGFRGSDYNSPMMTYDEKGARQERPYSAPPLPAPTTVQSPPSVAQALFAPTQVAQSRPAINPAIVEALSSPYADEGTKRIAGLLLQQNMSQQSAQSEAEQSRQNWLFQQQYEQQQQANDPARALQLEKSRLEIEAMRNPQPKETDDIREYNFAKSQGFPGTFNDFQIQQKKAGATNVTVGGGDNKQVFDAVAESASAARSAVTGLNALSEAKRAVDGGIISGAGADARLGLQRVGALLGVSDPQIIQNTETFRSAIAPQVAAMMKATVGSTQISNSDREFAQQAAGGSINLNEGTIKRLLGIMDRAARVSVQSHMDRLNKVYPDGSGFDRERALFGVDAPAAEEVAPKSIDQMSDEELKAIIDGR